MIACLACGREAQWSYRLGRWRHKAECMGIQVRHPIRLCHHRGPDVIMRDQVPYCPVCAEPAHGDLARGPQPVDNPVDYDCGVKGCPDRGFRNHDHSCANPRPETRQTVTDRDIWDGPAIPDLIPPAYDHPFTD